MSCVAERWCKTLKKKPDLSGGYVKNCLERYRSGHNEAVLKTVCPKGRMGSNPILSALIQVNKLLNQLTSGEVPKWLKGLPWKGSRSLVAARGFKSLLLRWSSQKTAEHEP